MPEADRPARRPDLAHDYHLLCLAESLRAIGITQRIGLFLHTPFRRRRSS